MRRASFMMLPFLLAAGQSTALTLWVDGAPGAPGADGGDAVATAASADLDNIATAIGGDGGESPGGGVAPGDGGAAEATAESSVGELGPAIAFARAFGGSGGAASSLTIGGTGGSASASATAQNQGNESVDVEATARGGDGGDLAAVADAVRGGDGGEALLGPVYGSSVDGSVHVRGFVIGGAGGDGDQASGLPSGDGASVHLSNAVDGDTSGVLFLGQEAQGGRAGEQSGGAHGETSSRLEVSKAAEELLLSSLAHGALDAESHVTGENTGGSIRIFSEAYGGAGRLDGAETAERGGSARAYASATSAGDGHEVLVAAHGEPFANAQGGAGAPAVPGSATGSAGRGGDAFGVSQGLALGDSSVTVEDRVVGGNGGHGSIAGAAPGIGGSAFSVATGIGLGLSPVRVSSSAIGGRGGLLDPDPLLTNFQTARSGEARATSNAQGYGEVESLATAVVGRPQGFAFPYIGSESGTARAEATAVGTSGQTRANAYATGFELATLNTETSAAVDSSTTVAAHAGVGGFFARKPLGVIDAFAIAAGRPEQDDVLAAIEGTVQVAGAFADDEIETVLSLGQIGFTNMYGAEGALASQQARLELIPNLLEVSALQDVMIGFMNPEPLGSGFDALRFRANRRGQTVVDETFEELGAALAYFDDLVLDVGTLYAGCREGGFGRPTICFLSPLELIFDWTGSEPGAGFGVDLIVGLTPVPEPGTALLFALGLIVLAARARRRRDAAI
jgi:hypothetical protein